MIRNLHALIHFLPPYSLDYNPIEYMFSKLKETLKAMNTDYGPLFDLKTQVMAALTHITPAGLLTVNFTTDVLYSCVNQNGKYE